MRINRKIALDELLNKLKVVDTKGNSDIDLILKYLEKFLEDPSTNKGELKKIIEFEIKDDMNTLSKIYQVSWRKTHLEKYEENK